MFEKGTENNWALSHTLTLQPFYPFIKTSLCCITLDTFKRGSLQGVENIFREDSRVQIPAVVLDIVNTGTAVKDARFNLFTIVKLSDHEFGPNMSKHVSMLHHAQA